MKFFYNLLIINFLFLNIAMSQKDSTSEIQAFILGEKVNPFNSLSSKVDLSVGETLKFPGVFFDPARLAMAKAGVLNDNDQANGLAIRGNNPDALQWRLEGVEILNPNHLSNAANWSNRAAAASGGVNMLSTQLLGTSSLLLGGFGAEYGNVISGIMDMQLRAGNAERHHGVAQIGLVGIDLAAEGPISKNKRLTYATNYRYSTVGLLTQLGVDFGSEKTAFQDLGIHLNYVGKKDWGAKLFFIKGNSFNTYDFDKEKDSLISVRQLTSLDFRQKNQILGFSANGKINASSNWKLSSSLSQNDLNNETTNYERSFKYEYFSDTTSQQRSLWATMLSVSHQVKNLVYKAGLFVDYHFGATTYSGFQLNTDVFFKVPYDVTLDKMMLRYGFYTDFVQQLNSKWTLQYGILIDKYSYNQVKNRNHKEEKIEKLYNFSLLPRVSFNYHLNANNSLFYRFSISRRAMLDLDLDKEIPQTNINTLQWKHQFLENTALSLEAFYQNTSNIFHQFSAENYYGITAKNSKNYGISTRFEKQYNHNLFLNLNVTLFRSLLKGADNQWLSTKYDNRFVSNLVIGKQWQRKRSLLGANCNIFFNGGLHDTPIDKPSSAANGYTFYMPNAWNSLQLQPYFRSDVRVYRTVKKKYYTATLSLDIQNVTNQQNVNFQYYDPIMSKVVARYQTGLVPILNYRMEF